MDACKKQWLEEIYEKICVKMSAECDRIGDNIPYVPVETEDGSRKYMENKAETDVFWWTNGFYAGMMWQLYYATGEEKYRKAAEGVQKKMEVTFNEIGRQDHDMGFLWLHMAVANWHLTGNKEAKRVGVNAAHVLASRFNPLGNFIRAWNGEGREGWMIIDCMMNLPLLYWMSEESGDPRFEAVAKMHADTAMELIVRPDGSCNHIGILDAVTGEMLEAPAGQGYASGSSWSRGQAWALYGFALSYHHTKEQKYLDAAKRIAHYFISNVALTDYLPLCDFRSPEEPVKYDSTAGGIAACGLLEIAEFVPEHEKKLYTEMAYRILKAMEEKFADWNPENDAFMLYGMASYHGEEGQQPIIYGDYFYLEAIFRMLGKDTFLW